MPRLLITALAVLCFTGFSEDVLAAAGGERQQGARTFVVAASDNFPPVNMLDKDGNLTGFGRDLSTAVISAIGGRTTYLHAPIWPEVLDYLNSGKADFIHDTAYIQERDVFLDFSDPILEMKEVVIVRPEQYALNSFESLKGKTVACVNKHITHLYLQKFPEIKCRIVTTPTEGLYALIAGDVDAFVYPEQIVTYLTQELKLEGKLIVTGEPLRTLKWSMVVREGDKELLGLLNEGIRKVRRSGAYERIYAQWFGKRIFAGYSRKEILFFGFVAAIVTLAVGITTGLLILNTRLRSNRDELFKTVAERKRVAEALQRSRRLLAETEKIGRVGGWEFDIDTGKQTWTEEIYRIHEVDPGYDPTVGKGIDFYTPASRPVIEEAVRRAVAQGEPFDVELEIITAKGNLRSVHAIGKADLEERRVYGFFQDITERKRAAEALRESEERFRAISANTPDHIIMQDRLLRYLLVVNPQLGLTEKDMVGKTDRDFLPQEEADKLTAIKTQVLESGKPTHFETSLVNAAGGNEYFDGTYVPYLDAGGRIGGLVGYFRNITERKRTEDALRESKEKYRNLFDNAEVGIFRSRLDGSEVMEVNRKFLDIVGMTREETVGKPSVNLWADPTERAEMVKRLVADGSVSQFEYHMLNKRRGDVRNCLTSLRLYREQGILEGSILDITERKQAEEELRRLNAELERRVLKRTFDLEQRGAELDESRRALINLVEDLNRKTEEVGRANARLQELDRLKSMFIASMSHELRTPLNSIIGFTGIILQGLTGEISAEQRKQLGMVQRSARHLLALINDIIDISKIEAGKIELAIREFDLAAAVREVVCSLETTAAGKGLKLAGAGPERLMITSDERRVKQIVLNLVGNAVKFTDQGEVAIRVDAVDGQAVITVSDSGPGIREEERELLFKAFSRMPTGDRTIKEGTGLGLYLSKRIADLLGGEITCASEYGKGSTFTFRLPP